MNTVMITPEYHTDLFNSFMESDSICECCTFEEQLFDFISEELGTWDWAVMPSNNLLSSFNKGM